MPLILIEGVADMFHTAGWRYCLGDTHRQLSLVRLFRIRMSGYAINYLTPTATLGGEVTKGALLGFDRSGIEAASGVIIGKLSFVLSQLLFVALGSIVTLWKIDLPKSAWPAMLAASALLSAGIFGFLLVQKYGIQVGGEDGKQEFDQIASFRRFLLFARDTIRWRRPMDPDIHWSAQSGHVSTFILNGGQYDKIVWTEAFNDGMQDVLDAIDTRHDIKLADIPRFNESEGHGPKRAHPVEDYFDDLSMHLVREIYKRDFDLFKYDFENPGNKLPTGEIDLDEVHAKLGD